MRIGLLDADLLDRKTNFPNLCLMKISGFRKSLGDETKLVESYDDAFEVDELYISKVFTFTQEPTWLVFIDKPIYKGGTGYDLYNAPPLPYEIEHCKPDYELYRDYAEKNALKGTALIGYTDASIGFTTRGCFRQCPFCVNRDKKRVEKWSPVSEFYDETKKHIFLLDDNAFGCSAWREIFGELSSTGKKVSYRQGLDLRLMDKCKAVALQNMRWYKDVIFAFDNIADKEVFIKKASLYRDYCDKETQCYALVGYFKSGLDEVRDMIERVNLCHKFNMYPFIMKHANYANDKYESIYVEAARLYNQRGVAKKASFVSFVRKYGSKRANRLLDEDRELRKILEKANEAS